MQDCRRKTGVPGETDGHKSSGEGVEPGLISVVHSDGEVPLNAIPAFPSTVKILIIYFFIICTFGKVSKVIGHRPLLELGIK